MRMSSLRAAVPFVDLSASHAPIRDAFLAGMDALLTSGRFINGPEVADFEREFAAACGVREAVGLASGHDALKLGLLALGLEPGDEVVIPAQTFVSTAEAVLQAGGRPVLADVDDTTACLDPDAASGAVTNRTRFVIPVHLFGQLADMHALQAVADRHDLLVLEDAAQSHDARRDGRRAGSFGTAAAFSFYPGKNLGAMGDAGALVTDDPGVAERTRALREHGQREKYRHELVGFTARLDTVQALFLALSSRTSRLGTASAGRPPGATTSSSTGSATSSSPRTAETHTCGTCTSSGRASQSGSPHTSAGSASRSAGTIPCPFT